MRLRGAICAALVFVCALALAGSAQAAFPGQNGKIAVARTVAGNSDIWTGNPDGTAATQLTTNPARDTGPAWSPDGTRIAFSTTRHDPNPATCSPCNWEIYVMNADGTGEQRVTNEPDPEGFFLGNAVTWSPDGTRLAFEDDASLWTVNPDGTGLTHVPPQFSNGTYITVSGHPAWRPDGTEIAFDGFWFDPGGHIQDGIFAARPDGSNARIINNYPYNLSLDWNPDANRYAWIYDDGGATPLEVWTSSGRVPGVSSIHVVWTPDGTRLLVSGGGGLITVKPDGSDQQSIAFTGAWADWQPIPINAYPRPKGATPVHASLVPAYTPCAGSPNREHGPPLAFASCNPPTQTSDELTVGSADSNGKPTRSVSSVRFKTLPGPPPNPPDEADVKLEANITDVYNQVALTDYTGELRAQTSLRITDKLNTPHPGGPGAGTVTDFSFGFTIPCAPTPDPNEGGACTLNTTADALYPGAIAEGRRAIWQLGAVEVYDGGADDDADTAADNTLFMKQGIFVP